MTLTVTRTRTHTYIELANPYLRCDGCSKPVAAFHNHERCGCGEPEVDRHACGSYGVTSKCPSWGPVDGCQCQRIFGVVEHGPARRADQGWP